MASALFWSSIFLLGVFVFPSNCILLGGREDVDINDADAISMAGFAADTIDSRSNSLFQSQFQWLIKAQKQLVYGTNWYLTFAIGRTDCMKSFDDDKKNKSDEANNCHVQEMEECTATVYDNPMEKTRSLEDFNCKPKGALVGGMSHMLEVSDDARRAAMFAVEELNARENAAYRVQLADVLHVASQVVAGIKYKLRLAVGATLCKNDARHRNASLATCPLTGQRKECDMTVVHTAWTPDREFTLTKCGCCTPARASRSPAVPFLSPVIVHGQNINLLGGSNNAELTNEALFEGFKNAFDKTYDDVQEEKYRFKMFSANMERAAALQRMEQGTARYGITPFSDLTDAEFRRMLSSKWDVSKRPEKAAEIPWGAAAPASFDWRDHNVVTPVKNQGMCGSCWAFSTTGNIEGQWAIRKGKLVSLSEQELVDCDKVDSGCEGGLPSNAYKAIIKLGGLELEKDYSYEGEDDKCKFDRSEVRAYINSSLSISTDEQAMAAWLAKNGPISIGINANAMQFYNGGISHPWKIFCNPSHLDHGVLIVGYGEEKGTPYWIIKNSWGPRWGEKGYYRVYRGAGVCGLNEMATSAVVN